jgi:filamentous hemagglutinin family protein
VTTTSEIGWRGLKIVGFIGIVGAIALSQTCVQAQITPDTILGSENSVVTPINGTLSDRIDGGATRGANLFHSFQEFNIDAGRGAYFSNPAGIDNILSRVTGNNPSNILGTLGVLGNANLFLMNPNGIIFGQGASLDIQGSFVASTADRIQLGESGYFNATEPQKSSLLAVAPGALFFDQVANQPGNIVNTGNLTVNKNLTLAADNLNLQGQLLAGENLTLQANDTVQVRDSVVNPFIAAGGGKLLVQGQAIDIFALNHSNSGLFAGKDLVLRADTIGGDAHFWSGGNFRIEQLDGSLGDWYSPYDPIIFVTGDLSFNGYIGASLHILAGGSVIVPGTIVIIDADTPSTSIAEDVTLSDGTVLPIDGSDRPTLDIRAGVDPAIVSSPNGIIEIGSGFFFGGAYDTNPSSADILVGNIIIDPPDGVVYLTNQYQPNLSLTSANIEITGEGISRIGAEFRRLGIDARGFGGNGSSVVLDSRGSIFLNPNASIDSSSNMSQSGDIKLIANEQISLGSKSFINSFSDFGKEGDISLNANEIQLAPFAEVLTSGSGGDIQIQGNRLLMQDFSGISALTTGTEDGGNIFIQADDSVRIDGGNIGTIVGLGSSQFGSPVVSGNGGDITIKTGELTITGTALFVGDPFPNGFRTGGDITSDTGSSGNAGTVTIDARQVSLTNGAQIRASTLSTGNAGDVIIRASEFVEVSGLSSDDNISVSKIASQITSGATGTGGDVLIETNRLMVSDGAQIQAGTFSTGSGGSLTINATQSIDISDTVIDDNPTGLFTGPESSGASGTGGDLTVRTEQLSIIGGETTIASEVDFEASGNAGNLLIEANRLIIGDGAQISAATYGIGQGGNLTVNATESINLFGVDPTEDGEPSGLLTATLGGGDAGDLKIQTRQLSIRDGATISSSSAGLFGNGKSGNITIEASDLVKVIGVSSDSQYSSSIATEVGRLFSIPIPSSTAGKNISITTRQLSVLDGAEISTQTFGAGNAGNLSINASESVQLVNGYLRTRTGGAGNAGNMDIITQRLTIQGGEATAATEGQGRGGNMIINAFDSVDLSGEGGLGTLSLLGGDAGDLTIATQKLSVRDGAGIATSSIGLGQAGDLHIANADTVEVIGGLWKTGAEVLDGIADFISGTSGNIEPTELIFLPSRITTTAASTSDNSAGDLTIQTNQLIVRDGAEVTTTTLGENSGGTLNITASELVEVSGTSMTGDRSRLSAQTIDDGNAGDILITTEQLNVQNQAEVSASTTGKGQGGNIDIQAGSVRLSDHAQINASSQQQGNAGSITINADGLIESTNSDILTFADQASGGAINISAQDIRLHGDSDIQTNVASGTGGGGNITLSANSILAFDDSDILAFAQDGRGGNIALNTPVFFGENFQPAAVNSDPNTLDGNNRVDINATGAVAGVVDIPDVSFIQNSLTELPANLTNTETLVANSCVARSRNQAGSFLITGTGGLPSRPGEQTASTYSTGSVRSIPDTSSSRTWQLGDRIVEPQGAYRLSNGRLILSRECS